MYQIVPNFLKISNVKIQVKTTLSHFMIFKESYRHAVHNKVLGSE